MAKKKAPAPSRGLNPKQQRFVAEYLVDGNATQAAVRAGYSPRTAHSIGHELLTKPEIRSAVDAAQKRRLERVEVKADDVLRELLVFAKFDIRKAFDAEGRLLPPHQMPEDVARAVSAIDVQTMHGPDGESPGVVTKVKFWDKPKGLELLGKYLKMFTDKVQVDSTVTIKVVDPYAESPAEKQAAAPEPGALEPEP